MLARRVWACAGLIVLAGCLDFSQAGKIFACPGCDGGTDAGGDGGTAPTCQCVIPGATCEGNTRLAPAVVRCLDDGGCGFDFQATFCPNGCSSGVCIGSPCSGVVCNQPPPAICVDSNTLRVYANLGSCLGGGCSYTSADVSCACQNGACAGNLCEGVTCNQPPPAVCVGGSLRTFAPSGTCSPGNGHCTYAPTDTPCGPAGCSNGQCVGNPCVGITCDQPPAPTCVNATTVQTSISPGTCTPDGGFCSYATTQIACDGGQQCNLGECQTPPPQCNPSNCSGCCNGLTCVPFSAQSSGECGSGAMGCAACGTSSPVCQAGACVNECVGVTCNEPPSPTCLNSSTLVTYTGPGTCSPATGTCSYPSNQQSCSGGDVCQAGQCVPTATCTLQVSPNPLSFGSVAANTEPTLSLTLTNAGAANCTITQVALVTGSDPAFTLSSVPGLPLVLGANGNASVGVTFAAGNGAPALHSATVAVESSDPQDPDQPIPVNAFVTGGVYSGGWPKWHYDSFNTGRSPADTSRLAGTVAWKFNVGQPSNQKGAAGSNLESPVVDAQGNVYYQGQLGILYALNPDGGQLWHVLLPSPAADPFPATPTLLANGTMLLATGGEQNTLPNFYVLSTSGGGVLYSTPFGAGGFSSIPTLGNDGTLFLGDDDGLPGNSTTDQDDATVWSIADGGMNWVTGAAIGFLSAANSNERLSVAVAPGGNTYWCSGNQCFGMTAVDAGFLTLPTWPGLGASIGTRQDPIFDLSTTVTSAVALDPSPGGYVYAYAGWFAALQTGNGVGGVVAAINPQTGAVVWGIRLPDTVVDIGLNVTAADYGNAPPAIASDSTVYVGHADGLRALDGKSGGTKWLFPCDNVTSGPAIGGDGTIFFGSHNGTFYAVYPDGGQRFTVDAGSIISGSPAIALDGTVYFVSDDGFLYALK
jgi:outer membrane protein assembly factor BamB